MFQVLHTIVCSLIFHKRKIKMNPQHRRAIESQLDFIVANVKMDVLWPKLIEYRVFNTDDCNIPSWEVS